MAGVHHARAASTKGALAPAGAPNVVALGNVGATSSVAMDPAQPVWVTATLTADNVCTITPAVGGLVRFFLLQDGTGGHTFTISDGTANQMLPVATAPGASTCLSVLSPDGTDLWFES